MKLTKTHGYLKLNRRKNAHGIVIIIPGSHPVLFAQRFKKKKNGGLPELVEMLTGVVARVVSDGSKSPVHFERQSLTN
jgi:hypothetical protein